MSENNNFNTKGISCNEINAGIDACILPLIKKLNENGFKTNASCCGHGNQPMRIDFENKKVALILDYDQAQVFSRLFPPINPLPEQVSFGWQGEDDGEAVKFLNTVDFDYLPTGNSPSYIANFILNITRRA